MFSKYDEYDKRRDRYSFFSYEEIDADQTIGLLKLLDLWSEAKIEIPDLLLNVSYVVGVNALTPLWNYHIQAQVEENLGKSNLSPKDRDKILAHVKTIAKNEGCSLNPQISEAIINIRKNVEEGNLDSWDLARAIYEVILEPYALKPDPRSLVEKEADLKWGRYYKTGSWHNFIKELSEQKTRYLRFRTKDIKNTLDSIKPDTEEDIKKTLSQVFNQQNDRLDQDKIFQSPIDFPERHLCDTIDIVASGTGLVNIHTTQWGELKTNEPMDGATVARITTYDISFYPINPETDLNALKDAIETAVPLLGDIPYRHELSAAGWDAYKRPNGKGNHWDNMNYTPKNWSYIDPENGSVRLKIQLDLDDTWYLYYLLEPIIKPTQQIAAAMNLARYNEERGVILEPDFYPGNYEHYIDDESDYLGGSADADMFTRTIKAAATAYFLRQSDEAEFLMRVMTIADQTAQGRMKDGDSKYISYDDYILIESNQEQGAKDIITYPDFVTQRTSDILKDFLLLPETAGHEDIFPTLYGLDKQVGDHIREHHAARKINRNTSLAASFRSRMKHPVMDIEEMAEAAEKFMMERYGTLDPGFGAGTLPTLRNQLVVADSNVETGLDGSRKGYRIRLKGSPFMRKDIPSSLKPFMNEQENSGSSVQRLMHFMM